jgi:phosphoserine phosphatase RsbU/P
MPATELHLKNTTWEIELNKTAYKYHSIILLVAIVLNPIWFISDYFTIPDYFTSFLIFRLAITAICIGLYFIRNKFIDHPEYIALIPFLGISLQNAYMYSVMSVSQLQTHTFAYIALFIGAGMMVLWKNTFSIIVVVFSIVANIIYFKINSQLSLDQILINGALLTATVAVFTIILIQTRTNLTKREIIARLSLAEKNKLIEEQNKDITDSINYAKTIQNSVVPSENVIRSYLPNSFIIYEPKDIVSGDFPFVYVKDDSIYVAAVDCTGHGVPGAFMSLVGHFSLTQALSFDSITHPNDILDYLHSSVVKALGQDGENPHSTDGMDIGMCKINKQNMQVEFAGAQRPLYIIKNGVFEEIKSDKASIGGTQLKSRKPYTNHSISFKKGDSLFIFSDGLQDQFGGPEGRKKFMSKNIRQLITDHQNQPMQTFKDILHSAFENWRGENQQTDDVLMIGIKF